MLINALVKDGSIDLVVTIEASSLQDGFLIVLEEESRRGAEVVAVWINENEKDLSAVID